MKLKRLFIKQYKNLIDFDIDFQTGNGLSILVGNNGSGKSNVLEALSGIFANAYAAQRTHKFIYSLTYEIKGKEVKLEQTIYRCQYYVNGRVIAIRELIKQGLLPSNVIALYSGEDKRWWYNFYEPFYFKFIKSIKTGTSNIVSPKMYYINKYYWDIALLSLIYSTAEDDKAFLRNTIGTESMDHILLFYTKAVTNSCESELLKAFLESVNLFSAHDKGPKNEPVFLHAMTKEAILESFGITVFTEYAALKNFYMFVDAQFLNNRPEEFNYYEKQVFDYLVQAYMPKDQKIITNIELIHNGFSAKNLSEGEKKLILIRAVLSFVAGENSLILFDEPDANIHEGRKQELYDLFAEFCKYERQIVIATHSPIIAQLAKEKELLMLEQNGNKSALLTDEKIEKIKRLSGTSWDVIGQGMILKSSRPLVVFEGKTDVMYVKRALDLLKQTVAKYNALSVDFLNANGAGNVKSFIENLNELVSTDKKIIVFFDRDKAGKDGAQSITGISKNDERIANYQDIVKGNLTVSFIPYKEGISDGDFLIEDYFSWDGTIKAIVEDIIPDQKHPIKCLPNLPNRIKAEIEKRINQFKADEFNGFVPLLDKILELSQRNSD